jgi:hypothetical protein
VQDVIFSVGARNDSRVLSLMSALPVNAGPARRQLINVGAGVPGRGGASGGRPPSNEACPRYVRSPHMMTGKSMQGTKGKWEGSTDLQKLQLTIAHRHHVADPLSE